ncbi:MAG: RHS repeat protein [Nitrospirae bacterium]|nr:RHS repeat protein [Nitrospirota bacterium]MBI3392783.1 RHS repeat protein [Nitrospirota bacterium]
MTICPFCTLDRLRDPKGNLAKRTEQGLLGGGAPYAYVTTYTYTTNGQIASIDGPRTDALDVTGFSYDAQGNLLSVTQPGGLRCGYLGFVACSWAHRVRQPDVVEPWLVR